MGSQPQLTLTLKNLTTYGLQVAANCGKIRNHRATDKSSITELNR